MSMSEMVGEFHAATGVQEAATLTWPTQAVAAQRGRLIREEALEAVDEIWLGTSSNNLPAIAKELADTVYVAIAAARVLGIDFDAVFSAVHASNMTKRGPNGEIDRDSLGKVLKGAYYQPPNIARVLEESSRPLACWGNEIVASANYDGDGPELRISCNAEDERDCGWYSEASYVDPEHAAWLHGHHLAFSRAKAAEVPA